MKQELILFCDKIMDCWGQKLCFLENIQNQFKLQTQSNIIYKTLISTCGNISQINYYLYYDELMSCLCL